MRIGLVRNLAHSMMREVQNTNKHGKAEEGHIPCVPANLRDVDSLAYEPKIISLGPYHNGKPSLQIMEYQKKRFLFEILNYGAANNSRSNENMARLETIFNLVTTEEAQLRKLYTLPSNSECEDYINKFIRIMVLDSCFILRFIIKFCTMEERISDHLFLARNIVSVLRGDLLLLENQIPFYILEQLYCLIPKPTTLNPFPTLKEIAFTYLTLNPCTDSVALNKLQPYHLLHMYNLIMAPETRGPSILNAPCTIPCAMKLKEAGIKISAKESDNLLDISFEDGKLEIPRLEIKVSTIPIFKNTIAFEQCSSTAGNHFTSYSRFLNLMVNRIEDVEVLQQNGILVNNLGNDEDVVKFLNEVYIQVVLDEKDHYLSQTFLDIDQYTQPRWKKQYTEFWKKYCTSPWAGISAVATCTLLLLALLSGIYTVLTYYNS